jgi:hypothetical protein
MRLLFFVYENSEERKKERKGKREMGIKTSNFLLTDMTDY